ncbi:hypothetical protein MtrunA17_Chr3g0081251 [Medicago truncatula]|uniref:Nodule Cysteine-Rich (NCR) secreted peptide n=1 Tax=Medicago truncatula TaxID=3880 RepID=A0A396INV4_MEDTR|nr:hypothetical protein MtrunA17_Chr3g0081251 [Medicago truncatula]
MAKFVIVVCSVIIFLSSFLVAENSQPCNLSVTDTRDICPPGTTLQFVYKVCRCYPMKWRLDHVLT